MYREEGIDFRRSVLFFGPPGTGKTFFIRQKSRQLVEALCAVVVRIESAMDLEVFCEDGLRELAANLPTRLKVVVIEEISEFFDSANAHMQLSSLLDSGSLNDGVLIMCTTNHPTKIPENIIDRPSRLDLLAPVYHDDNPIEYVSAWYEHLMGEEFPEDLDEDWVRTAHEELSPAYLKELFIHAKILGTTIRDSFEKIQQRRRLIKGGFKRDGRSMGF
jgi:SpoVK/Ycf46/Vps4 family AAA+-type ATPase